ncbi:NACHT domain-containing protein [Alteromonas ponticola]|nr:NACHT domain-containing protein [Alteromonas ponticola]
MGLESIITSLTKDLAAKVLNKTLEKGTEQYNKALVIFEFCFSKYLRRSHERYSKIKTLLYRDRPVSLKEHYVYTDLALDKKKISGTEIFETFNKNRKNVVVGTAGSGKSVLLKKIFCNLVENKSEFIPILVELRLLIQPDNHLSIFDYIYNSLSALDEGLTKEQLHYALKLGKVALLFDGFDEIDFEKKEVYEREILEISNKYTNSVIIVSSRPDDNFNSWDEFFIYRTQKLTREQAIDLVSRIDYDVTVKDKFINELKSGLYNEHVDFISNPLLLTMMLLTYEQLAEIPEKIHIFYEQAFDTLFHKHDALKSLYKRKSYTSLPIDDFKNIFSAFCIITYTDKKLSFTYNEIIGYISKAIEIEDFEIDARKFFNDLLKSVCIIQRDGNIFTFSHRSFQEYFTAKFLAKSESLDLMKILDNISTNRIADNVLRYTFELNTEKVEKEWILPRLQELTTKTGKALEEQNFKAFLSLFFDGFTPTPLGVGLTLDVAKAEGHFKNNVMSFYRNISLKYFPQSNLTEDEELASARIENDAFKSALNLKNNEKSESVSLSDVENIDWIKNTWIYDGCYKYDKMLNEIYTVVKRKYEKKEMELSTLLFN